METAQIWPNNATIMHIITGYLGVPPYYSAIIVTLFDIIVLIITEYHEITSQLAQY